MHTFCWRHSLQARFTAMLRRAEAGREPSASPFWKSSSSLDAERLKPRCWLCGLLAKPKGRPVPGVVGESWSDMDMMLSCSSCTLLRAAAPISLTEALATGGRVLGCGVGGICKWLSLSLLHSAHTSAT